MSMFPGPGAQVYYNEAGEPLGWDYPGEPEYDPDDWYDERDDIRAEEEAEMEDERPGTWYVTFEVTVEARTEDEAVEAAKQLIRRRDFEPTSVEEEERA